MTIFITVSVSASATDSEKLGFYVNINNIVIETVPRLGMRNSFYPYVGQFYGKM